MLPKVDSLSNCLMPPTLRCLHCCLISLLLLTGCLGTPAEPALPIPSPTILPTPLPATATKEVASADMSPVVRIRNAETGTYLYEKDGRAQLGDVPASDLASQWKM